MNETHDILAVEDLRCIYLYGAFLEVHFLLYILVNKIVCPLENEHVQYLQCDVFHMAVLLSLFQTMPLIQRRTVLQYSSSLPVWKQLSGLIHFGLVAQRRSWRVLVK